MNKLKEQLYYVLFALLFGVPLGFLIYLTGGVAIAVGGGLILWLISLVQALFVLDYL